MKELTDQELMQVVGGTAPTASANANGQAFINGDHGYASSNSAATTQILPGNIYSNANAQDNARGGQAFATSAAGASSAR